MDRGAIIAHHTPSSPQKRQQLRNTELTGQANGSALVGNSTAESNFRGAADDHHRVSLCTKELS
jgi:hypothetical protein